MPHIITTNDRNSRESLTSISGKYTYNYPNGQDFLPGRDSGLHKKLVDKVMDRARKSAEVMSKRHPYWRELDRNLTSYVDLTDDDRKVKSKDEKKPVTMVFPYSYAILETLLGYMVSAFFQDPLFQYGATSPKSQIGAILLEQVVNTQCWHNKVPLALHTMFRDAFVYSFGMVAPGWAVQRGYRTTREPVFSEFYKIFGVEKQIGEKTVRKKDILFEGNELSNIDPYYCLPDPNTPIDQVQNAEFFGWLEHTNYNKLLREEKEAKGDIFNVHYLKHLQNRRTTIYPNDVSDREKRTGGSQRNYSDDLTSPVDVINMYVDIIPKEWKVGKFDYPEKWFFRIGADEVLLEARPIEADHGMYPLAVAAPDFDGYSTTPVSRLETLFGLQGVVDFMFNSHIANVRKALNDMFIVDPYLVNVPDVNNPGPGKVIRTRRPAWGRGVKDVMAQLGVNDVTRQNVGDIGFVVNYMNRVSAVDEASMGSMRQGGPERLTLGEFQGTRNGAYSRLERIARIIGLQAMNPLGYMFASHCQQLMERDTFIKAAGENVDILMREFGVQQGDLIPVSPDQLYIDYDVIPRDGSIPGSNYSKSWENLFKIVASDPELREVFDITRIFKHIARNSGAKNVNEFVRIRTAPNEQVQKQVQAGNFIPAEQAGV